MKSEDPLTACIDANVFISALAFGGKPLKVIERAFARDFSVVTSHLILQEVRKNLVGKLGLNSKRVGRFIDDILGISSVYVPSGRLKVIGHLADDAVIETAILGQADVLVTGDKKHLLHLGKYQSLVMEPPSKFLERLDGKV